MKTRLTALIISGVVLFGSFSFVYALMYDCLNPPAWIKMPKSDIRYCLGLLANGHLPDYPTWEEYLASKETKPEPDFNPVPEPVIYPTVEEIEESVRQEIYDLLSDKNVEYYSINLDHKTGIIEIGISDDSYDFQIKEIISKYPYQVEFNISYVNYTEGMILHDFQSEENEN